MERGFLTDDRIPTVNVESMDPTILGELFLPLIVEMDTEEVLKFLSQLKIPIRFRVVDRLAGLRIVRRRRRLAGRARLEEG